MKKYLSKLASLVLVAALLAPNLNVSAQEVDAPLAPPTGGGALISGSADDKEAAPTTSKKGSIGKIQPSSKVPYGPVKAKIAEYQNTNSDVKGWLSIPGTNINVPVPQAKDNDYYINRTWNGVNYPNNNYKNYVETASYLDFRVKLGSTWKASSNNIVIYGHNWTNLRAPYAIGNDPRHEMFAQLASYFDINFAKEHPYIYFSTGENEGIWKIFAVAMTESYETNSFIYNTPNMGQKQFTNVVQEWRQRSLYNFDVDVNAGDKLLTLSTCIRHYQGYWDDQRYVVVARLLRPDENDTQAVSVVPNPNIKEPIFQGPPRPRIG